MREYSGWNQERKKCEKFSVNGLRRITFIALTQLDELVGVEFLDYWAA